MTLLYNKAELVKEWTYTPQGYAEATIRVARPGILPYLRRSKIRKELRRPETLANPEFLKSIKTSVLTNDHPVVNGKPSLIDASNTKSFAVGTITGEVRIENGFPTADVLIFDQKTIDDIKSGKTMVSMGSFGKSIDKGGTYNNESFDSEQVDIVCNHIALVSQGRAGPSVRLLSLDSALQVEDNYTVREENIVEIEINGKTFDLEESIVESLKTERNKTKEKISFLSDKVRLLERDKHDHETSLDSAQKEILKFKENETKASQRALSLAKLIIEAQQYLGKEDISSFDSLNEREIKIEVLKKFNSDHDYSQKSDEAIDARYEMLLEMSSEEKSHLDQSRVNLGNSAAAPHNNVSSFDSATASALERENNRWKTYRGRLHAD